MRRTQLLQFTIFVSSLVCSIDNYAQSTPPQNWHHLDLSQDNYPGISTQKAYDLIADRTATPVIVAVIDGGTDYKHEDLKNKIWINTAEKSDSLDNDQNGYIDDLVGWNFIGGKANVNHETYELTRIYSNLKGKGNQRSSSESAYFVEIKNKYVSKVDELKKSQEQLDFIYKAADKSIQIIKFYLKKDEFSAKEMNSLDSKYEGVEYAKKFMTLLELDHSSELNEIKEALDHVNEKLEYGYNTNYNPRTLVGDNDQDFVERMYGNNDVVGPDGSHGTHVAGIIAANRNNNTGIKGIAEHAQIMAVRVVPNGDERDKDVANGIRYAVDNGARIINMSFGKGYSPQKSVVDEAVRYAEKHGVLLVHAAGNDGKNNDSEDNFPEDKLLNGDFANNWIEVGASSSHWDKELAANFSNYGKESVDIFAPGVGIYSTFPDNEYGLLDGTSMAAPMVSGVAALLLSYFPELGPAELKEIILNSAVPFNKKVILPNDDYGAKKVKTKLTRISTSGGVLNAHSALQYAISKYDGFQVLRVE